MTDLAAMGLQSVVALPDGSLPAASRMPSYERDCKQGKEASSRFDDFFCTRRCGRATAAAAMEQPQVLTDNVFRISDHRPATIQVWRCLCQPPNAAATQTAAQAGFEESTHRGTDATLEGGDASIWCPAPARARRAPRNGLPAFRTPAHLPRKTTSPPALQR